METVPVLIISGSMGSGKTTVLGDASDLLREARVPHAAIDLDTLGVMYPPREQRGDVEFAALRAAWPIYAAAGAERLLIAGVVESRSMLSRYTESVPAAEITVCRLTAPVEQLQERLRVREPGINQPHALTRAAELADILEEARAEDFTIDNSGARSITDVSRHMLSRAGWL